MSESLRSRREFIKQASAAGLVLSTGGLMGGCSGSVSRPNIVIIFTDDQGYGDVGVYGARGYSTPNLDQLASEGMRFTDFYASQAVCSASRASLMTGCYSERVSILGALGPGSQHGLHPEETTIAEMLKELGYATAIFGKWHLGHHEEFLPLQHGFDEYLGLPYSNDMWPYNYDGRPATSGNKANHPPLPLIEGNETVEYIESLEDQDTLTGRYTERAVDFIRRHHHQPFFLYVPHSMPHVPLGVSDHYRGHSAQGMYGDVIEEIDWSVGQIMQELQRHRLTENTMVIFTCDNGPWLNFGKHAGSTGGLREGKGTAFEGGPRVPAIMCWPGHIPAGSVCTRMAATIDILPTIAAITGASLPERQIDGVNILPLLEGDEAANPRNQFLFYYGRELRGVREGQWKRVYSHRTRSYAGVEPGRDGLPGPYAHLVVPTALYDLGNDIAETTDVSDSNREIVMRLDAIAETARETLGDRLTDREGSEVRSPGRRAARPSETISHFATGALVTLTTPPSSQYPGNGASSLVDGKLGGKDHHDGFWLGFEATDLEAVVDLGEAKEVQTIGLSCLRAQPSWIFLPRCVEFAVSADGSTWHQEHRITIELIQDPAVEKEMIEVEIDPVTLRYIQVRAKNIGQCPSWHVGDGGKAWLFVDEIMVG